MPLRAAQDTAIRRLFSPKRQFAETGPKAHLCPSEAAATLLRSQWFDGMAGSCLHPSSRLKHSLVFIQRQRFQATRLVNIEPAKRRMFATKHCRFASLPANDDEYVAGYRPVHSPVGNWIESDQFDGVDAQLFEGFTPRGLFGCFAGLNMPARQRPTIGVCLSVSAPAPEQHGSISEQNRIADMYHPVRQFPM